MCSGTLGSTAALMSSACPNTQMENKKVLAAARKHDAHNMMKLISVMTEGLQIGSILKYLTNHCDVEVNGQTCSVRYTKCAVLHSSLLAAIKGVGV